MTRLDMISWNIIKLNYQSKVKKVRYIWCVRKKMEMLDQSGRVYCATWSNIDDYEDKDSFNICVYDQDGNYVMNNIWTKEYVVERRYVYEKCNLLL